MKRDDILRGIKAYMSQINLQHGTLSVFGVGSPASSARRDGQGASGSLRRRSKTPRGRSVDVAVAERL